MKDEAGAAEEDEADETTGAVEAVSAPGQCSNLPVEALRWAVAEAGGNEGENAVKVAADGLGEPFERPQARPRCPSAPRDELLSGDANLTTAQDLREGLLEQVGAIQGPVRTLDLSELVALDGGDPIWWTVSLRCCSGHGM